MIDCTAGYTNKFILLDILNKRLLHIVAILFFYHHIQLLYGTLLEMQVRKNQTGVFNNVNIEAVDLTWRTITPTVYGNGFGG